MPQTTTNFPLRPRMNGSWWTVWYLLQWFVSSVYDVFQNKFQQGTAVISNPATSVLVTGIFVGSAYQVSLTPQADPVTRYWVSGKTATQFQINLSAAPASSLTFDWTVKGQ